MGAAGRDGNLTLVLFVFTGTGDDGKRPDEVVEDGYRCA